MAKPGLEELRAPFAVEKLAQREWAEALQEAADGRTIGFAGFGYRGQNPLIVSAYGRWTGRADVIQPTEKQPYELVSVGLGGGMAAIDGTAKKRRSVRLLPMSIVYTSGGIFLPLLESFEQFNHIIRDSVLQERIGSIPLEEFRKYVEGSKKREFVFD